MTRVDNTNQTQKKESGVKRFFEGFAKGFTSVFKWIGKNVVPIANTARIVASIAGVA